MKVRKIGIVGSGHIGGTIGTLLGKVGYEICFSSRHPGQLQELAAATGPLARTGTVAEAIAFGELVVLALPMKAFSELDRAAKEGLKGKIVIDTSNPYPERDGAIAEQAKRDPGGTGSFVARLLPGARLVKAFNTVYYVDLRKTFNQQGQKIGIPIASDDQEGLQVTARLVEDAGLEPVIVGDLSASRMFDVGTEVYATSAPAEKIRAALGLKEKAPAES